MSDTDIGNEHSVGREHSEAEDTAGWRNMFILTTRATPYHPIPLAFLWAMAGGSYAGTEVFVVRIISCRLYYHLHPSIDVNLREGLGSETGHDPACTIADVDSFTDTMVAVKAVVQGLLSMLVMSIVSDLVSRWGRKHIGFLMLVFQMVEVGTVMLAVASEGALWTIFFIISTIAGSASSGTGIMLALNNYIVDLVQPEQRAPYFGYILAAIFLGQGCGSALGGVSRTLFNYFYAPIWLAIAVSCLGVFYAVFLLPESLTEERRQELTIAAEIVDGELKPGDVPGQGEGTVWNPNGNGPIAESSRLGANDVQETGPRTNIARGDRALLTTLASQILRRFNFLGRLSILLPNRRPEKILKAARKGKGRRVVENDDDEQGEWDGLSGESSDRTVEAGSGGWNITFCAIAFLLEKTGSMFVASLLVLGLTSSDAGWDQTDIGLLSGYLTFIRAFHLFFLQPWVLQAGRSWAARGSVSTQQPSERQPLLSQSSTRALQSSGSPSSAVKEPETARTNMFDIYWASASFFLCALGVGGLAVTTTVVGVYICVGMIALSGGGIAALQAFASELVDFSMTDSVLAAFSILEVFAFIASPLILGSIAAATAESAPGAAFGFSGGIVALAGVICLLVRDRKGREQKGLSGTA